MNLTTGYLQQELKGSLREGFQKNHWICDHDHSWQGRGVRGWWSHLWGFFSMLQTKLFGSIKPPKKLCINLEVPISYYFQYMWPYRSCLFHPILARYDHDHRFNRAFLEAFSNQILFQTYPKCVSSLTWITQLIKKLLKKKKNYRRSQFSKKRGIGGAVVRRGMIMITDSMFFLNLP